MRSNNEENVRTSMEKSIWATQRLNEKVLNAAYEQSKVILIFSVCKSMHFQGYAEMASQVGGASKNVQWDAGDPRSRGRSKWGGAFACNWIKIHDLPFHTTSNICNPLNNGKPVKFSRDGQEATEKCARALLGMIDEGAKKNGTGSCILRRNVNVANGVIARQKWLVNGKFVDHPPTDYVGSPKHKIPPRNPRPVVRPVVPPVYAGRPSGPPPPPRQNQNPYSTNLPKQGRNISRLGKRSRSRSRSRRRGRKSRDRKSRSRSRRRRRSRSRDRSSSRGRDRKRRKRRKSREREINLYALHQNLQLHQALQNQLSQTDPNILSQLNLGMQLGIMK